LRGEKTILSVNNYYLAIETPKSWAGTVIVLPEKLHNRTSTILFVFARINPIKPGASVGGQLGMTGSPTSTPFKAMRCSSQRSFGIFEKVREADLDNSGRTTLALKCNIPGAEGAPEKLHRRTVIRPFADTNMLPSMPGLRSTGHAGIKKS
jgi:hypothetical protein